MLVGPVGVKVGPPDKLDIPDIFAMSQDKVTRLIFHDLEKGRLDVANMSDEELTTIARNRETHGAPDLGAVDAQSEAPPPSAPRQRAPTLFIRGASDGLVSAVIMSTAMPS